MDCFLDPHTVEVVDASHFRGEASVGISFLRGKFRYAGEYLPFPSATGVKVRFHGSGMGSEVETELSADLSEVERSTHVQWSIELTLHGVARTLGDWLMRRTVEEKVDSFFDTARHRLEAR